MNTIVSVKNKLSARRYDRAVTANTHSMAQSMPRSIERITPREHLDFKLDESLPQYWFGGDPFKTRLLEAVCATFPEGERYFISSVRHYRDQITDPQLQQDVRDFSRQEGQHGLVHTEFNDLLQARGLPMSGLLANQKKIVNHQLKNWSPEFNIAYTAACEHVTALMADCFFSDQRTLAGAHPHVRAMLAWHSIEEMEHKAVAFDVMTRVAGVSQLTRRSAMLFLTLMFIGYSFYDAQLFLKADGFSRTERLKMMVKGARWAFGKKGILSPMAKPWAAYFRKDFHPWQQQILPAYQTWLDVMEQTGDPIAAGEALYRAGRPHSQ